MLIDEFLPKWDARERHSIKVNAPVDEVCRAMRQMDLRRARLTNFLLKLRGISAPADFSIADLLKMRFVILAEEPDKEIVLGLTGKFWQPDGNLVRVERDDFIHFDKPGYAKAAWNFSLFETADGAIRLNTETRIFCTDAASRARFRLYWFFIGAFSSLIRREILCVIKKAAESSYRRQPGGF